MRNWELGIRLAVFQFKYFTELEFIKIILSEECNNLKA